MIVKYYRWEIECDECIEMTVEDAIKTFGDHLPRDKNGNFKYQKLPKIMTSLPPVEKRTEEEGAKNRGALIAQAEAVCRRVYAEWAAQAEQAEKAAAV